jgi:uncharacterized protein YndB with AHSA1/START domain
MSHAAPPPIIVDTALDAPPERVWRALTEPALLARWLAPTDMRAVPGARFSIAPKGVIGDEPIDCEVLEAEPHRRLSYRWRAEGQGGQAALDTIVTWILDPTPDGGTRLRLVHEGFPIVVEQPARVPSLSPTSSFAANDNQRSLAWAA